MFYYPVFFTNNRRYSNEILNYYQKLISLFFRLNAAGCSVSKCFFPFTCCLTASIPTETILKDFWQVLQKAYKLLSDLADQVLNSSFVNYTSWKKVLYFLFDIYIFLHQQHNIYNLKHIIKLPQIINNSRPDSKLLSIILSHPQSNTQ